jgi:hypothetical protein
MVEFAISTRDSSSTGVSPFFLSHGYHPEPLQLFEEPHYVQDPKSPIQKADAIVTKIKEATEWAQLAMTAAQQDQEIQANRHRNPSPSYKVGDKVWLNLKNISTGRPNQKLADKQAKYTVVEVIGPYSYRLDVPGGIHNVFHVDLLRPASNDPLPSQKLGDYQPPPILVDGNEEYEIEKILDERLVRKRGKKYGSKEYLVKWEGWRHPTWEPASALEDAEALDRYLATREGEKEGGG